MKHQMALTLVAFLAAGACGRGVTSPAGVGQERAVERSGSVESAARGGEFHATKECSEYKGGVGQFCTITSSSLKEIPVGTRVYYHSAAGATLDSDITLDPPKPGNNTASGHVFLDFATMSGRVTLNGGTGKFSKISASAAVTHLKDANWAWDGTYSYGH